MSTFLEAAYQVLRTCQRPMTPQEIARVAVETGLLNSCGKTPWRTMQSKLSVDVLRRGHRSQFMRTEPGRFALRSWQTLETVEYVAPRRRLAQPDELLLVFPHSVLSRFIDSVGITHRRLDIRDVLTLCQPMQRSQAELDPSVIQLVTVFIVKYDGRYLTYRRSRRLPEQRLARTYTIVFGGHLTTEDIGWPNPLFDPFDSDQSEVFLEREFREELNIQGRVSMSYVGLVYDDSKDVSKQHLGIAFSVTLSHDEFTIGETGSLGDAKFESRSEIMNRQEDFENWTLMILSSKHDT